MITIKPPSTIAHLWRRDPYYPIVFLAGSIEMGSAVDWQSQVESDFVFYDGYILNPRRSDWDSSWVQSIDSPQFRQQVEWEMNGMDMADRILMHFEPETKSPITLLELGLHAADSKLIVSCPDGFWRKGNVEIVCKRYNIPLFNDLGEACIYLWHGVRT